MKKYSLSAFALVSFFAAAGCKNKTDDFNTAMPPGVQDPTHDTEEEAFTHAVNVQDRLLKGRKCLQEFQAGAVEAKDKTKVDGLSAVLDPAKIEEIRKHSSRRQGVDPAADIDKDDPGREWKLMRATPEYEAADNCLNLRGDVDRTFPDESNSIDHDFWDGRDVPPPTTQLLQRKLIRN